MNAGRSFSKLQRRLCLSAAAAFGFFPTASAPHRVHHVFEQLSASSTAIAAPDEHAALGHPGPDHRQRDGGKTPPQPNDCAVLSLAQNAHVSVVQSFSLVIFDSAVTDLQETRPLVVSSFNSAPRSQRAPPSF